MDIEDSASLQAVGTSAQPIIFTGEQKIRGFWDGLFFRDSVSTRNRLENVEVSYGGGAFFDANVALFDSRVTISNSLITESDTWGVCVDNDSIGNLSSITYRNNRLGNLTVNC